VLLYSYHFNPLSKKYVYPIVDGAILKIWITVLIYLREINRELEGGCCETGCGEV
jgi:hypothetical protein